MDDQQMITRWGGAWWTDEGGAGSEMIVSGGRGIEVEVGVEVKAG